MRRDTALEFMGNLASRYDRCPERINPAARQEGHEVYCLSHRLD